MKNRILITFLAVVSTFLFCSTTLLNTNTKEENSNIYGYWWNAEKTAKIKIYKAVSGKACGKITWLKDPYENGKQRLDKNNPDSELAKSTIINLVILKHLDYKGSNKWEDGKIYDPENGKTYSCQATLSSNKKKLDLRGYIGFSLIGRTSTWTKVE